MLLLINRVLHSKDHISIRGLTPPNLSGCSGWGLKISGWKITSLQRLVSLMWVRAWITESCRAFVRCTFLVMQRNVLVAFHVGYSLIDLTEAAMDDLSSNINDPSHHLVKVMYESGKLLYTRIWSAMYLEPWCNTITRHRVSSANPADVLQRPKARVS